MECRAATRRRTARGEAACARLRRNADGTVRHGVQMSFLIGAMRLVRTAGAGWAQSGHTSGTADSRRQLVRMRGTHNLAPPHITALGGNALNGLRAGAAVRRLGERRCDAGEWRARDDSNVRPLPSEGSTLSS